MASPVPSPSCLAAGCRRLPSRYQQPTYARATRSRGKDPDTRSLAHLYRAGELTAIHIPAAAEEALRELIPAPEDSKNDRRIGRQRVKSFPLQLCALPCGCLVGDRLRPDQDVRFRSADIKVIERRCHVPARMRAI